LTARLDFRWAPHLDLLIERCTANDPGKRPRMREVADELAAILKPATETIMEGTEDLERRIAAMTERHRRQDETRDVFNNRVTQAWHQLVEDIALPTYSDLARRLPTFDTRYPVEVEMPRALVSLPSVGLGSEAWGGMLFAPGDAGVRIDLGIALRVQDDSGRSTVAAVLAVQRHNQGRGWRISIMEHMTETVLGSAHFEATIAELGSLYTKHLPETLKRLAEALEAERRLAANVEHN
jgi:hypothetical protein